MNILAGVDIGDLLGLALRASIGVHKYALAAVGLNHISGYQLPNFGVAFMSLELRNGNILTQGWLGGSLLLAIVAGLVLRLQSVYIGHLHYD